MAIHDYRDLAVIRVHARNLPTVPLGNSDKLQLAQEVRAVGYPLSDVLGNNIKVTRGSIAGLNDSEEGRVLQVDAAINPGNSGGALVNESGQVVGVTSAKLTGNDVSSVGFAVPSRDVVQFLTSIGIPPRVYSGTAELSGPELAGRVTPAVGQLRVKMPGGNFVAFRYQAQYIRTVQSKAGNILRESERKHDEGLVVMDEFGTVLDISGKETLPYMLGPIGSVAAQTLSAIGEDEWKTEEAFPLFHVEKEGDDTLGIRSRSRFSKFGGSTEKPVVVKAYPAVRLESHKLNSVTNDVVDIKKKLAIISLDDEDNPFLGIAGNSDIRYQRSRGELIYRRAEFKVIKREGNRTQNIQVKSTINSMTDSGWASYKKAFANLNRNVAAAEAAQENKANEDARRRGWTVAKSNFGKVPPPKVVQLEKQIGYIPGMLAYNLEFSGDGKRMVVGVEKTIHMVSNESGSFIGPIGTSQDPVRDLRFNHDGTRLVSTDVKNAYAWDVEQRKLVIKVPGVSQVAITATGDKMMVGQRNEYHMIDFATRKGTRRRTTMAFVPLVPSGARSFIGVGSRRLLLFDADSTQVKGLDIELSKCFNVEIALPAKLLAASNLDELHLIDLKGGKTLKKFNEKFPPFGVAIDDSGKYLAYAIDRFVVVWDIKGNKELDRFQAGDQRITAIAMTRDGKKLATADMTKLVNVWKLP